MGGVANTKDTGSGEEMNHLPQMQVQILLPFKPI